MPSNAVGTTSFSQIADVAAVEVIADHNGVGPISFRRMYDASSFSSPIDFVDVTAIPPGSTIGLHEHHGTEELYIILAGAPLMDVNGEARRLAPGDVAVVRDGGAHSLTNDTAQDVRIGVVQVRIPETGAAH